MWFYLYATWYFQHFFISTYYSAFIIFYVYYFPCKHMRLWKFPTLNNNYLANSPLFLVRCCWFIVCSLVIFISRKSVKCIQKTPQWTAQKQHKSAYLFLCSVYAIDQCLYSAIYLFLFFFIMFWCCGCCLRNVYTLFGLFFLHFDAFQIFRTEFGFFYIVQNINKKKHKTHSTASAKKSTKKKSNWTESELKLMLFMSILFIGTILLVVYFLWYSQWFVFFVC